MMNPDKMTAAFHAFTLDPFQEKAIKAVKAGHSVLVSAPTGAGKTVIAEYIIHKALVDDVKVIYTAPIKALSNQKYREFQAAFPNRVGIVTGDVSISPEAPLLIMTTEIFKNRILENRSSFDAYSWIIFDEIHYIDDKDRGTVWEESRIFMPSHLNFLGLSATIPNIHEFARWIRTIHSNELTVVTEHRRPVPLNHYYHCHGKIFNDINKIKRSGYWKKKRRLSRELYSQLKQNRKSGFSKISTLLKSLKKKERIPLIYFAFSRKRVEGLAKSSSTTNFFDDPDQAMETIELYNQLCIRYGIEDSVRTAELAKMVKNGVAYHHAGLLPMQKEVIEQLFTQKRIKVIFTTETFALGINMPARTVIIDELKKKYDRFFRMLKVRDYAQMSGRAGRRGIDQRGFVYSFITPEEMRFDELIRLDNGKAEPVMSRFNANYSTILNLYDQHGDDLLALYQRSFHYFQTKKNSPSLQLTMMKGRLKILKKLKYIEAGTLTEKGEFAKMIHGYGLLLGEIYSAGLLEQIDYRETALLALAIVYEPKPGSRPPRLPQSLVRIQRKTSEMIGRIHSLEESHAITPLSKRCHYDLSRPLSEWMQEKSFNEILAMVKIDEGELIRYYRMAIQIMRELLRTPISDRVKGNIQTAIALMNHDVIDAEQQLKQVIETAMEAEIEETE